MIVRQNLGVERIDICAMQDCRVRRIAYACLMHAVEVREEKDFLRFIAQ